VPAVLRVGDRFSPARRHSTGNSSAHAAWTATPSPGWVPAGT